MSIAGKTRQLLLHCETWVRRDINLFIGNSRLDRHSYKQQQQQPINVLFFFWKFVVDQQFFPGVCCVFGDLFLASFYYYTTVGVPWNPYLGITGKIPEILKPSFINIYKACASLCQQHHRPWIVSPMLGIFPQNGQRPLWMFMRPESCKDGCWKKQEKWRRSSSSCFKSLTRKVEFNPSARSTSTAVADQTALISLQPKYRELKKISTTVLHNENTTQTIKIIAGGSMTAPRSNDCISSGA